MFEKQCQSFIFNDTKYVMDDSGELKQVLVDCSRSGRQNPHSNNKRMTNYLSSVYRYIVRENDSLDFDITPSQRYSFNKRSQKLGYCTNYLEFGHKDDTKRISYIESCHSSLCPCCNFFRARLNLSSFVSILTEFFNSDFRSYPFLFLTLTVRSCSGDDLSKLLDQMSSAWERFTKSKEFKSAFVASSRSLEITVNRDKYSKNYMMFHPHFHVILVARRDYFDKKSDLYLDNLHFLYLWQRSMNNHKFRRFSRWLPWYKSFFDDFGTSLARLRPEAPSELITQIDVRRIRINVDPDKAIRSVMSALNEGLKYPFKPDELLTGDLPEDSEVVYYMDAAMAHRRRWNLSGIFKEISSRLRLPEEDPEELVQVSGDLDFDYYSSWWFSGKFGEYLRGKKKTTEEKNAVRRFLGLPLIGGDSE